MAKRALISNQTNDAINEIVRVCFNGNSLADNIVYNLDIEFNMVRANDIVHHAFAHWLPVYADTFNDIQRLQNSRPIRLAVDEHSKTYESFVECFYDIESYLINQLEPAIKNAIKIADDNNDVKARIMLENAYTEITNYTKQAIIWHDKAIEYEMNTGGGQSFDKDFPKFTIISIPE